MKLSEMTNVTLDDAGVIVSEIVQKEIKDYTIKWTSSDETVATVSSSGKNGVVVGVSEGEATITAELTYKTKSCTATTKVRVLPEARDTVLVLDVSSSMDGKPLEKLTNVENGYQQVEETSDLKLAFRKIEREISQ